MILDDGDTCRECHACQAAAEAECTFPNVGDTVGNRHAGQVDTKTKACPSDAGYAVGNRHAGQAGAASERTVTYDRDGHALNAGRNDNRTAGTSVVGDDDRIIGICRIGEIAGLDSRCCCQQEKRRQPQCPSSWGLQKYEPQSISHLRHPSCDMPDHSPSTNQIDLRVRVRVRVRGFRSE